MRLISAKFIEQKEIDGNLVRKAVAPTFLHNGTYLISDSALWYLETNIINCIGNVRLLQGDTELTSEQLDYFINRDLAQFRGSLVQLQNKQGNILRTRILDYNTKDSVAVFSGGASMKSDEGQVIESDDGYYFNAGSSFSFKGRVNMYADSVFVKTDSLEYYSNDEKAVFPQYIDFWKDDNMLSAESGWYDRGREIFFFKDKVHALSAAQESWSDSLYYYRGSGNVLMLGAAQVQDSTRNVAAMSDYLFYEDSLARVTMRKRAAVAMWAEREGRLDTTYFGAGTLVYHTVRRCDIPEPEVELSKSRLETINGDPVSEFRLRAAEEARKKKAEARQNASAPRSGAPSRVAAATRSASVQNQPSGAESGAAPGTSPVAQDSPAVSPDSLAVPADSLAALPDSLAVSADSLAVLPDSVAISPDTSRVGYLTGIGDVRIFRNDMQVRCDSVRFCELDSIARFYKNPVIWNEGRRQYSADSLFVLVKDNAVDRASLMSNAFITVEEDSVHFDQIKSSEVLAYFDSDAALRRFDALGGVNAMFYLKENDELATVNKVDTRMLSASLKEGEVERVFYFESPKSDAYPIVQLPASEQRFKGFRWEPERRPRSPLDISTLKVKLSQRSYYASLPKSVFVQTERFFPGFMEALYEGLAAADSVRAASASGAPQSTSDSLSAAPVHALRDSLSAGLSDSLAVAADSLSVSADSLSSEAPEEYMSERELRRALRIARRDARWAALDARDADRAAAKAAKAEARRKARAERAARRQARREAKDQALLRKYIEYYENQKIQQNERQQESKPARERASGIETGRELQTAARPE